MCQELCLDGVSAVTRATKMNKAEAPPFTTPHSTLGDVSEPHFLLSTSRFYSSPFNPQQLAGCHSPKVCIGVGIEAEEVVLANYGIL